MKSTIFFFIIIAITGLAGCTQNSAVKKPKHYTVSVARDEMPVDGAEVKLVVWRKSEIPGAPVKPADVIFETQTNTSGEADIPVKRKSSFGIKATACLDDVVWAGDAWVSRKSERVQIELEKTDVKCLGE